MLTQKESEMKSLLILGTLVFSSLVFASIATAETQGESQEPDGERAGGRADSKPQPTAEIAVGADSRS